MERKENAAVGWVSRWLSVGGGGRIRVRKKGRCRKKLGKKEKKVEEINKECMHSTKKNITYSTVQKKNSSF